MEALGPDILEAIAYAQTMTPEEVEETIDYLLNEVLWPAVNTADFRSRPELNTARERSCEWPPEI